jgi:hypothetical protein
MVRFLRKSLRRKFRTAGVNLFIVIFLLTIFIDGVPTLNLFHKRLKEWTDPWHDVTGLWQGDWSVFRAGDPVNTHLEVDIEYDNGQQVHWRSPDWGKLNTWQKLSEYRHTGYVGRLESASYSQVRPALISYLDRRLAPSSTAKRVKARITSHLYEIMPPEEGDYQPLPRFTAHWLFNTLHEEEHP